MNDTDVCVLCVQRDTPTRLSKLAAVHTLYSLETIDVVMRAALASAETSALGGDDRNASSCKRERWRIHCSLLVQGTPATLIHIGKGLAGCGIPARLESLKNGQAKAQYGQEGGRALEEDAQRGCRERGGDPRIVRR